MAYTKKQTHQIESEVLPQNLPLPIQIDKVAKIRGWFRPPDNSIYFPILQAYLDGEDGLQETLQKITAPLDNARKRDRKYDQWGDLWYSVIHSARRIPCSEDQNIEKVVSLMKKLSGEPGYGRFPQLGMYAREVWNDAPGTGAGWTAPESSAWASYNHFLARLDQEGLFESLSSFGLWTLGDALERKWTDSSEDETNPGTRAQKYNATVPAAAAWVKVAGKKLYEQKEDEDPKLKKKDAKLEDLKDGEKLWPGAARFSRERWTFWKNRFGEIAGMEAVEEETRKVARGAAEAMEKVENS
jgi:hypothetical protein